MMAQTESVKRGRWVPRKKNGERRRGWATCPVGDGSRSRPGGGSWFLPLRLAPLLQGRDELGDGLEQVGDEPVVGELKDGGFGIFVDGDDGLGALHPGDVLDRARDADREVEGGSDDLPGLPDLVVARGISGIDGGAARADGGAERVCQGLEHLEELLLHGASTGHHYLGFGELGAFAL